MLVFHFHILVLSSVNIILSDHQLCQLCNNIFFNIEGLLFFSFYVLMDKNWVLGEVCIKLGLAGPQIAPSDYFFTQFSPLAGTLVYRDT